MWSEALAKALMRPFREHGMYDPTTSLRYRDLVLRPGGKLPADTLVYSFLEGPWSLNALHAWLRGED